MDLAIECQVLLNDVEVMADIGAFAAEQGALQPFSVSVAIPPLADDLNQVLNYFRIRGYALQLARQRTALIETFARRLAEMCLRSA